MSSIALARAFSLFIGTNIELNVCDITSCGPSHCVAITGFEYANASKTTGLSRTALTLIVDNKNSPTLRTLLMISSAIGVDIVDIINEARQLIQKQNI